MDARIGIAVALALAPLIACGGPTSVAPDAEQDDAGPPADEDAGSPAPVELCDGADNDSDGYVDEAFDLRIDPDHCGNCDTVCTTSRPAVPTCVNGACRPGCPERLADCDTDLTDCEADLATSPAHCGECGRTCLDGFACIDGVCGEQIAEISLGGGHYNYTGTSCVRLVSGAVWCWGAFEYNIRGDAESVGPAPLSIGGAVVEQAAQISAGGVHVCALLDDRATIVCSDPSGITDYGTSGDQVIPDVVAISSGGYHNCALTSGGAVHCWGANHMGQLGRPDGKDPYHFTPELVVGVDTRAVAAGFDHTCVLDASGNGSCWGSMEVALAGDRDLIAGFSYVCARRTGETLDCRRGGSSTRVELAPTEIAGGMWHACAVVDGVVGCWGANDHSQLGPTPGSSWEEVAIVPLPGRARLVGAGPNHSCAVLEDNTVWCWGANWTGQLGVERPPTIRATPIRVRGLPGDTP